MSGMNKLLYLFLILSCVSCTEVVNDRRSLDEIENLIDERPYIAMRMLDSLDFLLHENKRHIVVPCKILKTYHNV